MVIEAGRRVGEQFDEADVRIPLSGPFSLATNLMGFENILCEIQTDPDSVAAALRHLVDGQVEFCKEACDQLKRGSVGRVEAKFGCPSIFVP